MLLLLSESEDCDNELDSALDSAVDSLSSDDSTTAPDELLSLVPFEGDWESVDSSVSVELSTSSSVDESSLTTDEETESSVFITVSAVHDNRKNMGIMIKNLIVKNEVCFIFALYIP